MRTSDLRRLLVTACLTGAGTAVLAGAVASGSAAVAATGPGNADLAAVRAATAKYHQVSRAEADGYVRVSPCEEHPGLGTMGFHYLHPELASDAVIDPTRPELLLYVPSRTGLQLAAVEYFVAADLAPEGATVLGRPLEGPMAGHTEDMPVHYDLHVWLWKHNPAGMTAPWNPALSCDAAATGSR
jgi:hypothetical protein